MADLVQIIFSLRSALSGRDLLRKRFMLSVVLRFIRDEAGITPVEYGLIAAILIVAMTVAVSAAGFSLADIVG